MIDYEKLTPEEKELYDEARMTHGERYQAAQDWHDVKVFMTVGLFVILSLLYLLDPLLAWIFGAV